MCNKIRQTLFSLGGKNFGWKVLCVKNCVSKKIVDKFNIQLYRIDSIHRKLKLYYKFCFFFLEFVKEENGEEFMCCGSQNASAVDSFKGFLSSFAGWLVLAGVVGTNIHCLCIWCKIISW